MSKKTLRNIISGILAFILTMDLFVIAVAISFTGTLFNRTYIMEKFSESDFYRKTLLNVVDTFKNHGIPGGVPEEVFDNIIDEQFVYRDITAQLDSAFSEGDYRINTEDLEKRLLNAFNNYAEENNIETTEEGLNGLVKYCSDDYKTIINNKLISALGYIKRIADKILIPVILSLIVFGMIIIAFLFKLHRFKHRAMRYMAYGAIAGFIMTAVIPMFMFYNRFYTKIQITPEYMKTFVVNVVEGFLNNLLIFGIGIGVAAVLIIGLIVLVKRNYEKKSKTHDSLM